MIPVMYAARNGDLHLVGKMLQVNRSSINEVDKFGLNALHYAIASGNAVLVNYFNLAGLDEGTLTPDQQEVLLFNAALCKNTALVQKLEGQGVKYDHFTNKHMRYSTFIKETGHVLGLSGRLESPSGGDPISTENFCLIQSALLFQKLIGRYTAKDSTVQNYLTQYKTLTDKLTGFLKSNASVTEKDLLEEFYQGKPSLLRAQVPGHAFGVMLFNGVFGNCLVIINRGAEKLPAGVSYFIIPDNKKHLINETFIRKLEAKEQSDIDTLLKTVVDLQNPFTTGKVKDQEHGNCTFVNVFKGPMLAFLFLSILNDLLKDAKRLQDLGVEPSDHFNLKIINAAQEKAYSFYKMLTNEMVRNGWLEILLELYNAKQTTEGEKLFIVSLLLINIVEHHGVGSGKSVNKRREELNRALIILQGVSKAHAKILLSVLHLQHHIDLLSLVMSENAENFIKFLVNPELYTNKFIINYKATEENTFLHLVVKYGTIEMLNKILTVNDLNLNPINTAGETPLLIATRLGKKDMIEALVAKGVEPNAVLSKPTENKVAVEDATTQLRHFALKTTSQLSGDISEGNRALVRTHNDKGEKGVKEGEVNKSDQKDKADKGGQKNNQDPKGTKP